MMATMTGTDRKAFKSELRAALRRQALGIPQPTQADALLLWMDWLHRHDRDGARRLMAWAIGTRLTDREADQRQPRRDAARVFWT
jgi:hypothetical protein